MKTLPVKLLRKLYGTNTDEINYQISRYTNLITEFSSRFNVTPEDDSIHLFSSPGRSEIGGNHTDHNFGKVVGASIQLDCIGAVQPTKNNIITIYDITYNEDYTIDITNTERIPTEKGSQALVRGIINGFKNFGYTVGGFNSCFTSDVIAAAGVSSSAAFEMILCIIISNLFNKGLISINKFAAIGQYSENEYWDKSSGQLDQLSCAVGGMIHIDFEDPNQPKITKIPFDFSKENYSLMLVNTGKGHADLSAEYSSIPAEMKLVAKQFDKPTLRGIDYKNLINRLPELRETCGDRAILRAFHFIEESNRSDEQAKALKNNDFNRFLQLVNDSGNSSWKWLQNIAVPGNPKEQPIAICLALTERFIREKDNKGACRVHGGGFAGVILAFLPNEYVEEYTTYMEKALDWKKENTKHSPVYRMTIRSLGCIEIK
jgi:galactokinase